MSGKVIVIIIYQIKIKSETIQNMPLTQGGYVFFLIHCSTGRKPSLKNVVRKITV